MDMAAARLTRLLALGGVVLLVVAACTSAAGAAGWTYAPPVTTPAAVESAGPAGNPSLPIGAGPSASPSTGSGHVIQLDETADLKITDPSGTVVSSITVQQGQTYTFQITNTAGFAHDFYIGSPADLGAANTANLTGVGQFISGTQSFTYTFASSGPLGFGCTLPGHYASMHGLFVIP
jgi:hypothetical protein